MREILFRGKRTDNGEWVEGCFIKDGKPDERKYFIQTLPTFEKPLGDIYEVDSKTIGQFTGLCDKNGKKIFEGNIVKYTRTDMYAPTKSFNGEDLVSKHLIYWNEEKCCFYQEHYTKKRCIGGGSINFIDERAKDNIIEVIGNIHDNPELLEEK